MLQPELVDGLTCSAQATWSSVKLLKKQFVALADINGQLIANDEVKSQQHDTASC